ncbi:hypothetical protein SADUNF_Sadunf05G0045800 [Salix dunnii]|uniref:Homeobox-leucine zipper protein n=1 Tax=Salix dunnii TaxID=1413687 RepID=A0A835K6S7_9ROSI|nr:hypothetical protein SADUNF_Sadunf05G0045800 [Salix dunnii]
MKRSLGSSDSLGALMSICPNTEEHSPRNNAHVYSREFQSMLNDLDEEGCVEESGGHVTEKKRRLSGDQVKALEKNFEVENKLEPERKVKLAQELGLQPRQVAVWFQNRRARWKTKQLERDYGIRELKAKLNEENTESNVSVKEEIILAESEDKVTEEDTPPLLDSITASENKGLNYENFNSSSSINIGLGAPLFPDFKDGSSDSDSSAILNEDNSPNPAISSSGILQSQLMMSPPPSSSLKFNCSTSSSSPSTMNCFQFSKTFQTQFVKLEEHNFFSSEEACNFFSDEQPPTLHCAYLGLQRAKGEKLDKNRSMKITRGKKERFDGDWNGIPQTGPNSPSKQVDPSEMPRVRCKEEFTNTEARTRRPRAEQPPRNRKRFNRPAPPERTDLLKPYPPTATDRKSWHLPLIRFYPLTPRHACWASNVLVSLSFKSQATPLATDLSPSVPLYGC